VTNTTEEDSKARSRTFFKGIVLKELFSTGEEWHAFLIGFFETLCPWSPKIPMPERYPFPVEQEYHYYLGGRAAGFVSLLLILVGIITLFKEVIL